ncbi:hypothetical protein KCU85_g100, partial [Aureobasidium melanogenum]
LMARLHTRLSQQLGESCLSFFARTIFGPSSGNGDGTSVVALLATVVERSAFSGASLFAGRRVSLEAR